MEEVENLADKFQQDLGAVIDEYAEKMSYVDPSNFYGDYKEWGNAHLVLLLVARDFMEMNFMDITEAQMPAFNPEDVRDD